MTDIADIHFTIDGRACTARPGQTIVEAARDNHIYIPVLCRREGLKPAGSCRVCTVRVNGRYAAACTLPVGEGMVIENDAPDLQDIRRAMVEMLYVEGNHFCPSCEKSGNCELQALAYRFRIVVPRFPYQFPHRRPDGSDSKILLEHNRCIQCRRCIRSIKAPDGRAVFGMLGRSRGARIDKDPVLLDKLSEDEARRAMDLCPVGTIIRKGIGFAVPIGRRRFDAGPIGGDVEESSAGGRP
jgi:[NiFe] hydrogenase diaphorase moiety small subunit